MLMYQVENAALPGRAPPPMDREVMLMAAIPLEPLYRRWPLVSAASAEIRAAQADAAGEAQHVMLGAARAFYDLALAQLRFDVARDLAGWLDTVVAYNDARVREGVTAGADLIRAELEHDRAEADATMREVDLARARAELAAYVGPPATCSSRLLPATQDAALTLPDSVATSQALAARPEVRAARERLAAARATVAFERTGLLHELSATVGTKQTGGTTSLIAGLSLPLPLFGQNRGQIGRAAAEHEAAGFDLIAHERTATAKLLGASEAARLLTARARELVRGRRGEGYLARADEGRRIALGAYREGAVPLFQAIDAARAWGEARVAYHEILYAQHQSVLEMVVAQGSDLATALPALMARKEAQR
jgi:cobalt-zinc-cadmium efflux system outer membrane protein